MTKMMTVALLATAMLPGCKQAEPHGDMMMADVQQMEPAPPPAYMPPPTERGALPGIVAADTSSVRVSLPQIAYVYSYGFELPSAAVGTTLDRHVALCDRLGGARCRVLNMDRKNDGDTATGSLKLVVDAKIARLFGDSLVRSAATAGGSQSQVSIEAEDLSKQIVDTEARLRAKRALATRLMELLQTRKGPVADLVAAERSVAEVQEEIDAAQSWLAEARGRVAMSTMQLSYWAKGARVMTEDPNTLGAAAGSMGRIFSQSLGTLLMFVAAALPWAFIFGMALWGLFSIVRRFRRRRGLTIKSDLANPTIPNGD
jgi:hypothetical protein